MHGIPKSVIWKAQLQLLKFKLQLNVASEAEHNRTDSNSFLVHFKAIGMIVHFYWAHIFTNFPFSDSLM